MTTATDTSLTDAADRTKLEAGGGAAAGAYFPRRLRLSDHKGETHYFNEREMLEVVGAKVVLGEPGLGKSELMREVGRILNVKPITAVRFMFSKHPAKLVVPGKPLLIDGLDEAMARREGDAVDTILAQLEEAGTPEFILSCRAREWQARSVTDLRQLYGRDPEIFTLEPLARAEAREFLVQRYENSDADHVLDHLDVHRIADLYRNPLTLGLMGKVAEHDTRLPSTRAELFERVSKLIWPEHDPDRQDSALGQITEDQATSAAGAIAAGLLFAGAEAVSLTGAALVQDGDVRIADLETLPGAQAARAVFSSKHFQSVGVGRAKPIHRVIAEYLGARWLAPQAATPRAQRRLLAQLQGSGAVPASLRGLHSWLAFHSPAMSERVIVADPYGVLRYGETANLTVSQAACLFEALCSLADSDPYFRASDWDRHTAAGLMVPGLRDRIDTVIKSAESNGHLRSLLIEAIKGAPIAEDFAPTLVKIMQSSERFYGERKDAAEALLPYRDRTWWRQVIADLRDEGTEDGTRLARSVIELIECDVDDQLLVSTLFSEMGATICPLPRAKKRRSHTIQRYRRIVDALPTARLASVIDRIADYSVLLDRNDWQSWKNLAEIIVRLITRAIDEKAVGPRDAGAIWHWLGTLEQSERFSQGEANDLQVRLDGHEELRRAIQLYALYTARPEATIWLSEFHFRRRMISLAKHRDDVVWFLERLADADKRNPALRKDWCDLMHLGIGSGGSDAALKAASEKFQRGDAQLDAFVRKLENPKKPAWERKRERQMAQRERKRKVSFEFQRRAYASRRSELRGGDLAAIVKPAMAYLGLFSELNREQPASERVAEWLGPDLRDDTMAGLEAVLHRTDLPTAAAVAQGFAQDTVYNHYYAIMAGLLERQRAGAGFGNLTPDVRTLGLLLCHNERHWCDDDDFPALLEALEALVIPTAKDREDFAKLWIEPSLAAGRSHVPGLYMLAHDEEWQATGAALAGGWLTAFPNVPENIELKLVDCLTHSNALTTLASIAIARANTVSRNFDHMLAWLAIDVLVRFDAVLPHINGVGARNPEFIWFLRDRLQLERRGSMLPLTTAQATWIISEFRRAWPYAVLEGSGSGNTNPYDASDFLRALISHVASNTSAGANEAMQSLIAQPVDSYSNLIRHMAAEQRQKRAEEEFSSLPPKALGELLAEGPPSNADDLKSLVLEEMAVAQKKLIGDDIDQVRDFWGDNGVPYDENRCRDRLAAIIGPELARYEVQRITEADMPKSKRADLAFAHGQLQLPMEVKGQWHPQVWDAATGQLDLQYLIDWRSEQRGIYCVLWFGDLASKSGRRLKVPPKGVKVPETAQEMCKMLIERIPESRRALIDVVVLDLTAGRP